MDHTDLNVAESDKYDRLRSNINTMIKLVCTSSTHTFRRRTTVCCSETLRVKLMTQEIPFSFPCYANDTHCPFNMN